MYDEIFIHNYIGAATKSYQCRNTKYQILLLQWDVLFHNLLQEPCVSSCRFLLVPSFFSKQALSSCSISVLLTWKLLPQPEKPIFTLASDYLNNPLDANTNRKNWWLLNLKVRCSSHILCSLLKGCWVQLSHLQMLQYCMPHFEMLVAPLMVYPLDSIAQTTLLQDLEAAHLFKNIKSM